MMTPEALRHAVAEEAVAIVRQHAVLGMGTGKTIQALMTLLIPYRHDFEAIVPSSKATEHFLKQQGFPLAPLSAFPQPTLYVDGADAADPKRRLIKGGGGAMTREKILATASKYFLCLIDESKRCDVLLTHEVPIEVLPFCQSWVARALMSMKAQPRWREGVVTDNGLSILDISFEQPEHRELDALEHTLKTMPGVLESGLFAMRRPDRVLCATQQGILSF